MRPSTAEVDADRVSWRYRRRVDAEPAAGAMTDREMTDGEMAGESAVESPGAVIEVRRSDRRTRTVSARREGDRIVVLVPARMSRTDERVWVARMVERLRRNEQRRRPSDDQLTARAAALSARFFAGAARPVSVTWSTAQNHRWGSCTPLDATIRISARARDFPAWVLDYILVHELAHLIEASHSAAFWELVAAYPQAERAKAWLEGFDLGARQADG